MSETSPKGWVDLTLPSLGIFYRDAARPDVELIPNGKVKIRKLTVSEMATLQSPGMDTLQRLAGIIRMACQLPGNFSADSLLLTDRQAILIYQRIITLGASYTFTYRCPACRQGVKHTTNLLSDLAEITPDELRPELEKKGQTLEEPFSVELPDEQVSVSCRFLRGADELELMKRSKRGRMASVDATDPSAIIRLALVITAVNGDPLDTRRKEQMVRAMTAGDQLRIEHAVESRETGVDTTVYPQCTVCGHEVSEGIPLPFDREFFRPTADSLSHVTGTQLLLAIPRKGLHGDGA